MDLDTKTNQKHNHRKRSGLNNCYHIQQFYLSWQFPNPLPQKEHKTKEDLKAENKTYYGICNKPIESTVLMAAYKQTGD